jgi:hypothetical protein
VYGNSVTGGTIFNIDNSVHKYCYSLVEGTNAGWASYGTSIEGNTDVNPLFVNTLANANTLQASSTAINSGTNEIITTTIDLANNIRIRNNTVDLGANEYQNGNIISNTIIPSSAGIVYIKQVSSGTGSGNS